MLITQRPKVSLHHCSSISSRNCFLFALAAVLSLSELSHFSHGVPITSKVQKIWDDEEYHSLNDEKKLSPPWYISLAPFCLGGKIYWLLDPANQLFMMASFASGIKENSWLPGVGPYLSLVSRSSEKLSKSASKHKTILNVESMEQLLVFSGCLLSMVIAYWFVLKLQKKVNFDSARRMYKSIENYRDTPKDYYSFDFILKQLLLSFLGRVLHCLIFSPVFALGYWIREEKLMSDGNFHTLFYCFLVADTIRQWAFFRRYWVQSENLRQQEIRKLGKQAKHISAFSWTYAFQLLL